jgi:hypothetical protein
VYRERGIQYLIGYFYRTVTYILVKIYLFKTFSFD